MTQTEKRRKEIKGKIFENLLETVKLLVTEIEKDRSIRLGEEEAKRAEQLKRIAWTVYGTLFNETRNSFQYDCDDIMRRIEKCWNV